jgi:hypothetical protein
LTMTIRLKQLTMETGLSLFNGQTDNDCPAANSRFGNRLADGRNSNQLQLNIRNSSLATVKNPCKVNIKLNSCKNDDMNKY